MIQAEQVAGFTLEIMAYIRLELVAVFIGIRTQSAMAATLRWRLAMGTGLLLPGIRIKRWTIASCDFPQTTLDSGLSGGRHVAWVAFSCCLRGYRRSEFGQKQSLIAPRCRANLLSNFFYSPQLVALQHSIASQVPALAFLLHP